MRRGIAIGWGAGLLLAASAVPARAEGPTYHREVAPILQKHCQDCHRPGEVAPFPLLDFEHARKRAADLVAVTSTGRMPPWPASTEYGGPFLDERILPEADVDTLAAWLEAGCPEGDPADGPEPRTFASDWPLGEPDVVLTMPESYALEAAGDDDFRVFVLRTDLPEDRWIKAVDFKPGNRRVVHHVIAAVDTSGVGRELDDKDPGPGYTAIGGFGDGVPIRAFLPIWTPGARPKYAPEGAGYVLPKGADVLIQVHYHKSGKPEADATSIGLYLADEPQSQAVRTGFVFPNPSPIQALKLAAKARAAQETGRRPSLEEMMGEVLVIPAGEAHYRVESSTDSGMMGRPLRRDVLLTSVMPHMHWLGKEFTFTAVKPDGTRVPLIRIDRWDFNWQGTYAFAEPIPLPAGTNFEMEATFDNSDANPYNPAHPPRRVVWGNGTNDEMCIGIYEYIVDDRPAPADGRGDGTP